MLELLILVVFVSQNYGVATRTRAARVGGERPRHEMKALEDGPPAVAAVFGVRQTGACRTRHGLRGRRYAVSSLELVGRGGLGRRLLDGLRELEVVVVDPLLRLVVARVPGRALLDPADVVPTLRMFYCDFRFLSLYSQNT